MMYFDSELIEIYLKQQNCKIKLQMGMIHILIYGVNPLLKISNITVFEFFQVNESHLSVFIKHCMLSSYAVD